MMFHYRRSSPSPRRDERSAIVGDIVRGKDWTETPLGDRARWPASLRSAMGICLGASAPIAIFWGRELTLLYNDAFARLLGDRHPDALGSIARDCFADCWDSVGSMLEHTRSTGEATGATDQPAPHSHDGGCEAASVDYSFSPIPGDDDGSVAGVLAICARCTVDVVERRRTELLLDEQTELLELINAGTPLDECMAALRDSVRRLEPRARALIQLDDYPHDGDFLDDEIDSEPCHASPVLRPDGSVIGRFLLCFDEPHELSEQERRLVEFGSYIAGIAADRDRSNIELHESETQFRSLFDSIDQGFAVLEKVATAPGEPSDYLHIATNPAFVRQTGLHDAVGKLSSELLPGLGQRWLAALDEVIESGEGRSIESEVEPLERVFDVHIFPTGRPEQRRLAVLFNDVTDRHRAAEALEAADRAKDEFLAMLGHELRNPLSPMVTALELMRLRGPDLLVKERTVIERQVQRVVSLVDDLLDVSRITRGKVELERKPIELAEVIAEAIETVDPLLQQREQTIGTAVAPRMMIAGDARRLVQIAVNLLTNAAKYSPPGCRIEIAARPEGEEAVLRVRDHGIGIEASVLPHVFELFAQGRQHIDRAEGGLGLGLAIVKNLVTLHGGSVSAHSEGRDKGSEFVVRLPLCARQHDREPVAAPEAMREAAAETSQRKVLIVDDNVDAADSLSDLLGAVGYQTRIAHDGSEALDAASDFRPDVALVDIGLPVLDGYEVARRLRDDVELSQLPLIAVTGYGQRSDRQRALDAGFQEHVVKPIDPARLSELVERFAPLGATPGRAPR